jgi:hypothetical protein
VRSGPSPRTDDGKEGRIAGEEEEGEIRERERGEEREEGSCTVVGALATALIRAQIGLHRGL